MSIAENCYIYLEQNSHRIGKISSASAVMKFLPVLSIIVILIPNSIYGQINIKVEGVSEEIKEVFEARFNDFSRRMSGPQIPESIYPASLAVSYKDGNGSIQLNAIYGYDVFHNKDLKIPIKKAFSVLVPYRILSMMSLYQTEVFFKARRDEIKDFNNILLFMKPNKDWIALSSGQSGINNNVIFSLNGKRYETESADYSSLSRSFTFIIGETTDLDGQINANHYLCQFFGITP